MRKVLQVLVLLISLSGNAMAQLISNQGTIDLGDPGKGRNRFVIPIVNHSENYLVLAATSGSASLTFDIPQFIGPYQSGQVFLGRTGRGNARVREVLTISDGKSSVQVTIKARVEGGSGSGCYDFRKKNWSGRAGYEIKSLRPISISNRDQANKSRPLGREYKPAIHLVALVDVSGSMGGHSKLEKIKNQLRATHAALRPHDRLSILIYSEKTEVVLESVPCMMGSDINLAIDGMLAGGFTNGGAGIESAVNFLKSHQIGGIRNQIILFTDGDFNLGNDHSQVRDFLDDELSRFPFVFSVVAVGSSQKNGRQMKEISRRCGGQYCNYDFDTDRELFLNRLLMQNFKI